MPSAQAQLAAAFAVFGIVVLLMLYNALRPARARAVGEAVEERPASSMLARFATHHGAVVGEVVAVDGERLVLKQGGRFRVVPRAQAREEDGEVRLSGDIDWVRADLEGSMWYERNRRQAETDVTGGTLTTSADVRSPALEALQREQPPSGGAGGGETRREGGSPPGA